ncbi:hypothetical protein BpHYR1_040991 [Brachionus plicatilis]|uniref:Uncharacterized protein n=1 Tax=Brachionus plicatilis TaxID=10195 RepID=A0A3M7QRJ0_BRAPC|nr:hypothetical protein BpHYR1_040991 [Brachionus plicatilis]
MLSYGGFLFRISSKSEKKINSRCIETKSKCFKLGSEIWQEYQLYFNNPGDETRQNKSSDFELQERRREINSF